jgi:hypothetical protein
LYRFPRDSPPKTSDKAKKQTRKEFMVTNGRKKIGKRFRHFPGWIRRRFNSRENELRGKLKCCLGQVNVLAPM